MKAGGTGGVKTKTGLHFERRTDLASALTRVPGFRVQGPDVFKVQALVGRLYTKHALYSGMLPSLGIRYQGILSKKLLPDDSCYALNKKVFTVIEKKYQQRAGSVDEKLQTCHFKKRQYERLFAGKDIKVQYCYVLSDWFKAPGYRDVLEYIEFVGCRYFYGEVPVEYLELA